MLVRLIALTTVVSAFDQSAYITYPQDSQKITVLPLTHVPFGSHSIYQIIRGNQVDPPHPCALLYDHQSIVDALAESVDKGCDAIVSFDQLTLQHLPVSYPLFLVPENNQNYFQPGITLTIDKDSGQDLAVIIFIQSTDDFQNRKFKELAEAILNIGSHFRLLFGFTENFDNALNQSQLCTLQTIGVYDPQTLSNAIQRNLHFNELIKDLSSNITTYGKQKELENCIQSYNFPQKYNKLTLEIGNVEYEGIDWYVYIEHDIRKAFKLPIQNCSKNCTLSLLFNSKCDESCNNFSCFFDMHMCNSTSQRRLKSGTCVEGCYTHQLGDGECNEQCDVYACDYDMGDCEEAKEGSIKLPLMVILIIIFLGVGAPILCVVCIVVCCYCIYNARNKPQQPPQQAHSIENSQMHINPGAEVQFQNQWAGTQQLQQGDVLHNAGQGQYRNGAIQYENQQF